MPAKFGLTYRGKDNTHKTPLGTHERFIGFPIEHYAGNFPLWLARDQVRVSTLKFAGNISTEFHERRSCHCPRTCARAALPPVVRPKKSAWKLFREVLGHGGPGYLQFAITNICNSDCGFCGFARSKFDPKARRSVTLQEARDVVDLAAKNHIGYLLFVVRSARDDAHDIVKHETNRGLPDVCRKIKKANEFFHRAGIQTTASITASRLIEDYDKLPAFLESLGFRSCTFSYPITSLAGSYLSFSDSGLVNFSRDELIELFKIIKR